MTRSMMLAIPFGLVALSYAAATEFIRHPSLDKQFAAEREVVDLAAAIYGPTAVYDNGQQLPASIEAALVAGNPLPAAAPIAEVPREMAGRLPHTEPSTTWVRVSEHLLEVRPDNTIVMGVYDVLP